MEDAARSKDTLLITGLLEKLSLAYGNSLSWSPIYHYGRGVQSIAAKSYTTAVKAFKESIEKAKASGNEVWITNAQDLQAWALERMNENAAALTLYEQREEKLLKEADSKSDTSILINASLKLAYNDYIEDDYVNALLGLQGVLGVAQAARDTFNLQRILYLTMGIQDYLGEEEEHRKTKDLRLALLEAQDNDYNKIEALNLKMDFAESEEEATYYFNQLEEFNKQGKIINANEYLYSYATWLEDNVFYTAAYPINQRIIQFMDTDCSHMVTFYYTKNAILHYYAETGQDQRLVSEARALLACVETRGDLEFYESVYGLISKAFASLNQTDSAYYYLSKSLAARDSARATKDPEKVMKVLLQEKFDQEKEVIRLKQEKTQAATIAQLKVQRSFIIATSIISVLFLLVALLWYRNFQMQKKTNVKLAHYTKRLELSNQRLDRFASGVSHDILSKLNLVLSMGNIMVQNKQDTNSLFAFYEKSMDATRRIRDYCVNLLDNAQPPAENKQAGPSCDADKVLEQAIRQNEELLQENKLKIVCADVLPRLPIEGVALLQIFQNLLGNSITVLQGQADPQIQIKVLQSEEHTCIGILDNGPGIPLDQREKVFEAGVSYTEGSGLGLDMVRSRIAEVGGKIWIEESTQGGAAVWMRFYH